MTAIVTDSTSDLLPKHLQQYGIISVPLYVLFGGNMYKDGLEIRPPQIFKGVREGKKPPSTSQPSPAEFADAYRAALERSDHVLSLHISGQLSGTVGSARLAAEEFKGKVTVMDTQAASGTLGMQVLRAAERLQQGVPLDQVIAELERVQKVSSIRFTVDTLDFLKANGRIGGAQALLGGLLNIKPILELRSGRVEAAGRVRGTKKAVAEIVTYTRSYVEKHGRSRLVLLSTEGAEQTLKDIRAGLAGLDIEDLGEWTLGAVIATHTGPGTVGVCLEPVNV